MDILDDILDILDDIRDDVLKDIHMDIRVDIHTDIHTDIIRYPHGFVTDIDSGNLHGYPIGYPNGCYRYYGYVRMYTDMYGYPYISVHIRIHPYKTGSHILHGYVGPKLDMKGYPCGFLSGYPLG